MTYKPFLIWRDFLPSHLLLISLTSLLRFHNPGSGASLTVKRFPSFGHCTCGILCLEWSPKSFYGWSTSHLLPCSNASPQRGLWKEPCLLFRPRHSVPFALTYFLHRLSFCGITWIIYEYIFIYLYFTSLYLHPSVSPSLCLSFSFSSSSFLP